MTEFMADNHQAPNGPSPFPPREGAHLAPPADAAPAGADLDRPGGAGGQGGQSAPTGPNGPGGPGGAGGQTGPSFAPNRSGPSRSGPSAAPGTPGAPRATAEVKGRIHIADEVVEKVAALAAIEVDGVADLGGDFERAVESVRERIGLGSKRGDQGVKADVKGHEVAINVTIMVEYGHVVLDVARQVQANVARKTHRMLGLKVVEVNVTVDDVRTSARDEPAEPAVTAG